MSLLLVIVDPAQRTLQYVNAGHPGLILVQRDGVRLLEKHGGASGGYVAGGRGVRVEREGREGRGESRACGDGDDRDGVGPAAVEGDR